MTRSKYDDLHDKYDPVPTTKAGTRYERLVAMAQKILDTKAGVTHDLKLVGQDSDVPHQIDVTITRGRQSRRVLIECKDLDVSGDPVGLPIVRDFFGAVDDIKPDEAIIVTCNRFTDDAMKYAKAKGIKLAVLRNYTEEDDTGRIKAVQVTGKLHSFPTDVKAKIVFADQASLDLYERLHSTSELINEDSDIYLHRPGHDSMQYIAAVNELLRRIPMPMDDADQREGKEVVEMPGAAIQRDSGPVIPIRAIVLTYVQTTTTLQFTVECNKIVELILTPIGEDTDFLIYADDLARFTIDPETGEVIPRPTN